MGKRRKVNSGWGLQTEKIWETILRENPLNLLKAEIHLAIQVNKPNYKKAVRELLLLDFEKGQEIEICNILLDCCGNEATYCHYYGNIADELCDKADIHEENLEKQFVDQYSRLGSFDERKILNIASFFGDLFERETMTWWVLGGISLREKDLTEKSRLFLEVVFRKLAYSGVQDMYEHFWRLGMYTSTPSSTRSAIQFFTSIGLYGITENLLKRLERGKYVIRPCVGRLKLHNLNSSSSNSESESDEDFDGVSTKKIRKGKTTIQLGDN